MYFQNIVIHVAYHNNKFTDLYIIGEKKKKKNRIKTTYFLKFIETFDYLILLS